MYKYPSLSIHLRRVHTFWKALFCQLLASAICAACAHRFQVSALAEHINLTQDLQCQTNPLVACRSAMPAGRNDSLLMG